MTQPRIARRPALLIACVAALAIIAVVLVVILLWPKHSTTAPAGANEDSAVAEVSGTGVRLALGNIVITGDADVAPAGTLLRAGLTEQSIPGDFGNFAEPVTPVVDITLGDGMQPKAPLTIEFSFTKNKEAALDTDRLFVMGESGTDGREVDVAETSWDAERRVLVGKVKHLSWYAATQVDAKKLDNQAAQWLDTQAGVRTQKPDCVDAPIHPSGSFVLATPWPDAVWVCATESEDEVTVSLQSNSGLVYEVLSDPDGSYGDLAALSPAGVFPTYVARYAEEQGFLEGDAVVLPGGTMDITYERPFESAYIEVQIEPVLSQVSSLVFGAGMLLPAEAAKAVDWYSCGADGLETLAGGEALRAMLSCVAAQIGGSGGGLLGILATGPGLIFTQAEGMWRTWQGTDNEGFTVTLIAADAVKELPPGAQWLFDLTTAGDSTSGEEDSANLVTVTAEGSVASYPFSTNHWISCVRRPSMSAYALKGEFDILSFRPAVQAHAPAGMVASFTVLGDGQQLWTGEAERDWSLPRVEIPVTGVQELTVIASTDFDSCTGARKGWGALVQAYVQ